MEFSIVSISVLILVAWLSWSFLSMTLNLFSPLSKFPGPKLAAATEWWKTFVECGQNISFCHKLQDLHEKYGVCL